MNIRSKIIAITLPLIFTPLIITLIVAILSARNGITYVATDFLTFKTEVLTNYMNSQWNLLLDNDLGENEKFVSVTKDAIGNFSRTLISSDSEIIFALDGLGEIAMSTADLNPGESDRETFAELVKKGEPGWHNISFNGSNYVANGSLFTPFDWYVLIAVERKTFYGEVSNIIYRTLLIFLISLGVAITLLFLFSSYLTKPLEKVVDAIRRIIETNDLSTKVTLQYKDETGKLGHYFNIMTGELDKANDQMKRFALQAVIAKRKEEKIRHIFQKYVPKSVIDRFYSDPESMLVGENRILAILFSDIRSFTTISEGLPPDVLVESLNKYFELMVEVITKHNGIVDKYIGDAIMAFFGAPVHGDNDALQAAWAGLDMIDALKEFNRGQREKGREEFMTGIGINYGIVTIGNIGSEKKMDYTVIGDMVNLASRMEGLTKLYKEPLLISESMQRKVASRLPCRMIDRVIVKGKTQGVKIFSVRRDLSPEMKQGWDFHEKGIELYYNREFEEAKEFFAKTLELIQDDYVARLFYDRCEKYILSPPPPEWSGDTVLNRK